MGESGLYLYLGGFASKRRNRYPPIYTDFRRFEKEEPTNDTNLHECCRDARFHDLANTPHAVGLPKAFHFAVHIALHILFDDLLFFIVFPFSPGQGDFDFDFAFRVKKHT